MGNNDRILARCAAGAKGNNVGTYSVPVLSTDAGKTFRALWAKCTGAGHVYGLRLNIQVTNAAATSSNALRAELDCYHTSGSAMGGGAAIHAAADLGPTNTGHVGLLAGLNASILVSGTDARSLQGTYAALSLQSQIGANNTMPPLTSAFIFAQDAGSVKLPAFIFWNQAAAASSAFEAKTAQANEAMVMAVNVNGVMWYVPMTTSIS